MASTSGGEILVLLLLAATHCFAQEILRSPESTTVFLNQPAVFTCETRGGTILWIINGTQRETFLPDILRDLVVTGTGGVLVQTLTIPARAQYNGTRVQCASVIFRGPVVESDNATLTIQGPPLSAVGDLRVISSTSSVTISWGAPFSLDVTGVDPDIWYSVLIYNVTDENNPTAILCTDCINITETHYTFTPDYLSPCQVYNFSVIPLNGAGQGESSPFISGYVLKLSALIKTHIRAISRNESNVTFTSNHTSEYCSSWRVTPDVVDDRVIQEPPSPEGPDVTYQLLADNRYSFLVSLPIFTSGVALPRINFTTYDVQSAAAATSNGTNNEITLTGEFIENTTAQGCFVVLQCEYGNPDVFRALLLPDDFSTSVQSTIHDVVSSKYNMFVYDLEEDGLPNSHPAVEQNTTVTVARNGPIADAESQFLKNGSLYWNETAVTIRCEFKERIEGASCVLVYREYGNKTLVVEEYPQNTVFPVTMTVGDDLENYTFALFGKDGSSVDERPIIAGRMNVTETTTPTITVSTSSDGSTSSIAVGVSAVSLFIIIVTLVILAVVPLIWWKKSHKGGFTLPSVFQSGFSCPSPSETDDVELCSNASVRSGAQLISDDGDAKQKKGGRAEGEAKPPFSGKSFHLRQDSGISVGTPPPMSKQKATYTSVEPSTSGVQPPIPEDSIVQYTVIDIRTTHKMALSPYADLGPLPTSRQKPPKIETKTRDPYVDVLPHAATPVAGNSNRDKKNADQATPKGPPTVESVMSLLWGVAGRWREIAEGLEFDEDLIDEIDTNNDMDEGCLQVCVEMWIFKLQPSWEKLSRALKELGEVELARQAGNKEPQEQRQVRSRQTSDSSSSGVVADASSESSDFSGEVVPGVEKTVAPDDGNNEDGNRGGKKTMPNDCSSGEQGARSVFLPYPALHEEGLTVSGSSDEDEDTKCDVGTVESGEGEKATIVSGTDLFDFPYKPSLEEFHVLPPLDGNDDQDFAQDPVSTQGLDADYHSGSISPGRQKSAATMDTAKVVGRDVIAGGVVVVPRQCIGFSGMTGPEETDTARGPFRPPAKEVVNDSLSSCVNESQQSAGRFGLNKAVYPSLSLLTGLGMLVVGGPYTRRDIFKTVPREPSPEPEEPQPSPEETDSSQPLPPDPTPPQSQHAEVSPVQLQENNPPSPPPPPPPLQSSEIEEKVGTHKKRQYLDPPGNYQEKIMKWLHTGVSRGFRGPDLLVKLFTGGLPIGLSSLLQQPFRHT